MPTELDNISAAIGRLESNAQHIRQQVDDVHHKIEKLQAHSVESNMAIKSAHKRLDVITPKVDDHESLKNKGTGIIATIGVVFGLIGAFLGKVFHL